MKGFEPFTLGEYKPFSDESESGELTDGEDGLSGLKNPPKFGCGKPNGESNGGGPSCGID